MRISVIAAVALVASVGSVSAADEASIPKQFSTLNGVKAVPMSSDELLAVKGMDHHFLLTTPGQGVNARHDTDQHQDGLETDPTAVGKPGNFKLIEFPQFNADGTPQLDPITGEQIILIRVAAPSYNGLKHACLNNVVSGPGFLC